MDWTAKDGIGLIAMKTMSGTVYSRYPNKLLDIEFEKKKS
jgi:hypothetical protein